MEDLTWANNDMNHLLHSMGVASVSLNENLLIRHFTTQARQIFKLIASDAGRSLSDIVTHLTYPAMYEDAGEVLRSLLCPEKQLPNRGIRWYKVSIAPCRTQQDAIDGCHQRRRQHSTVLAGATIDEHRALPLPQGPEGARLET